MLNADSDATEEASIKQYFLTKEDSFGSLWSWSRQHTETSEHLFLLKIYCADSSFIVKIFTERYLIFTMCS